MASPLLGICLAIACQAVEKGYHANALRKMLHSVAVVPVIPGRRNRKHAISYDTRRYRDRHLFENAFCRLKDFRRLATRYDKRARNVLSAVVLATLVAFWLRLSLDPGSAGRVTAAKEAIREGVLDTRRGKTSQPVWVPLPAPVAKPINAAPQHQAITLCANSRGRPWTVSGFRVSWRRVRTPLEEDGVVAPGLTLKGLRHTVAKILAEMGCDEKTIADMLGQKTTAMARHYSRRADKPRKMTATVRDFDVEVDRRRTKIVKPDLENVKPSQYGARRMSERNGKYKGMEGASAASQNTLS